ncbi:hypothetical protein INP81_17540 [Comamonas thiooxydans]|uniref:hypothetical protein n=1 Tax=Comamonas thiooxydans TaxID=363952 RepID=UPI0018A55603|nr:hypothetical protein [Comamonas thiooxydans]QOQ81137.1 hypothetical protein INP81_17540 [Comamonas thiooxydans]
MLVTASALHPPPFQNDFELRLNGPDRGLINAWQAGLNLRVNNSELVEKALAGELPPLPFKGGIERKIQAQNKVGSLWYVAMWQGLRGEDLHIDTEQHIQLVCSKTRVPVIYTLDTATLFSKTAE